MRAFCLLGAFVAVASAAPLYQEPQYAPIPYQFAYKAESDESTHGHSETSDGNGNSQGEYYLKLADGRSRNVRYTADGNGFVAEIETNELGTESKDSADVKYTSSAITGVEAALQYGAQPQTQQVKIVQTPAPVVKVVQAPARVVKVQAPAPIIKYTAPAPTIIKTIQSAPVYKTYAAPTIVKTIQSAPVSYAVAHHEPVSYALAHHDEHHIIAHH